MWVEGQQGSASVDPLTPSNATPAAIAQTHVYEAQGNGYAIESYRTAIPKDTNPPFVNEGEIIKVDYSDGYLYRTNVIDPTNILAFCVANQTVIGPTLSIFNHYIVTGVVRVNSSTSRGATWYISDGTVQELQKDSNANSSVTVGRPSQAGEISSSFSANNGNYNTEFRIIQLD